MKKTMDEIAIECCTDKASRHATERPHNYCPHYELFFAPLRESPVRLLEIGVSRGESIRMWMEYFPYGVIFGVDNNPEAENVAGSTFVVGDQSDAEFWKKFNEDYGNDWDIIVEDGGHFAHEVITTWRCLWPQVKPGGYYCIEDLACSYHPVYQHEGFPPPMDLLKAEIDRLLDSDVASLYFSHQLCIMKKKGG